MTSPHDVEDSVVTRRALLLLLAIVPLTLLSSLRAEALLQAADEPPVVVTRNDGTTVRGKLVDYDRDKLTLEVAAKPKEPATRVEVAWADVKRVSNGLTREKALQKWKSEHREQLCDGCHGDGMIFCTICHGTTRNPEARKDCAICKGAAQVACKTLKCEKGQVPCPNTCLKLSDSGWTKKPDGMRWRRFPMRGGGYAEWSERHVGELIVTEKGEVKNLGKCPTCGGTSTVTDTKCRGTGMAPCPACLKQIDAPPCPATCDGGLVTCEKCKGSGTKA